MTIKYHWENVEVHIPCGDRTKTKIRDVDYEFDVNVKIRDVVQFLMPCDLTHKKHKTKEEANEIGLINHYLTKAINYLTKETTVELEELKNDPDFYSFMKDRYEDSAWESFQDENEEY